MALPVAVGGRAVSVDPEVAVAESLALSLVVGFEREQAAANTTVEIAAAVLRGSVHGVRSERMCYLEK